MAGGIKLSADELALKRATGQAAKAAGGQEAAALSAVAGRSQLQRAISDNCRDSITVRDAVSIDAVGAQVEGHPFILRAYAAQLRFGLHRLPDPRPDASDWLDHMAALSTEAGEVVSKLSNALRDGMVCRADVLRLGLSGDVRQLLAIAAALHAEIDALEADA